MLKIEYWNVVGALATTGLAKGRAHQFSFTQMNLEVDGQRDKYYEAEVTVCGLLPYIGTKHSSADRPFLIYHLNLLAE